MFAVDGGVQQLPAGKQCSTSAASADPDRPGCSAVTDSSITLDWGSEAGVHQWYIARDVPGSSYIDGALLASSTLAKQFTELSPNTAYRFLFWWRASSTDPWVQVLPSTSCTTTGPATSPAPPMCSTTTSDSVTLKWAANSGVYQWHIARPGTAGALIDSRLLEARTHAATFTGLSASNSYTFPLWWQTSSAGDWNQVWPDRSCTTQAAATTPVSTACAASNKYCVTRGVLDAVLRAARKAITSPTGVQCTQTQLTTSGRSQITQNMLASMMLAVPAWELNGGVTSRALSPMTLSRGDNMVNRTSDSNNIELYSHMSLGGYKRAHWNPGVGLWQLDNFTEPEAQVDALRYGHAERADVDKGGYEVAKYMRYRYCKGMDPFNRWFACSNSRCQNTHDARYVASTDSVQVEAIQELTDPTGGIHQRLCRWGNAGPAMVCYLFDLSLKEGHALACCPTGTVYASAYAGSYNPYTPEAAPFISFTDTVTSGDFSTKYAVWPKAWPSSSTGLAWPTETAAEAGESSRTIIRAVRSAEGARFSPYNDDSNPAKKGIAYHGVVKLSTETVVQYEARVEAEIVRLNGGPLTVNNRADGYGFGEDGRGPEGWFDSVVNSRDLQLYNCPGAIGGTLIEACWASTNTAAGTGSG